MSVINTNVGALRAQEALTVNNRSLSTAMQRLSTGSRINSAADDAAGLSIATRMDTQVRGLNMAIKNANDAISVTQTAEGAMQEVNNILQRMRELAVQSSNDTNSDQDRSFLQAEVSQLSSEIDRIAGTTQFNAINILDGGFKNKTFQIGANAGQTMGISIGSMKASVLGVASGSTSASAGTDAPKIEGATATGKAAVATVASLEFKENDTYTFDLEDSVSGLKAGVAAKALDLGSEISKKDFADTINKNLKEAAANTVVTGSTTIAATTDITDAANFDKLKFSVAINGGTPALNIDIRQRLMSGGAVSTTAVTAAEIATAVQKELQAGFDTSLTATIAGGKLAITDAQGRKIEVAQGAGSGALFGTDIDNKGSLTADATVKSNISVAWSGNKLMVTNAAGGKIDLSAFSTTGSSQVVFDSVKDAQAGQFDPITLVKTAASDSAVTYSGKVETSSLSIAFSDRVGDGTDAKYAFKLTDGAGHVFANLTGASALNVKSTASDADIVAAVKTAIASGITALTTAGDMTFKADEFGVQFEGNTLTITNSKGRAVGIENFSSTAGYATVTPLNELGAAKNLASQSAYYSEARLTVNSSALSANTDYSGATEGNKFQILVDGVAADTDIELDFSAGVDLASGSALATALQTKIQATTDVKIYVNGADSKAVQDLSSVTVTYDDAKGQISIRDSQGRQIGLRHLSTNALAGSGLVFKEDGVTSRANNTLAVQTSSGVAKGDVYEASKVTMKLSDLKADLNFKLNGTKLDASNVTWDTTQAFAGSTMKSKLDALMTALNADHPNDVFEYSVSGNEITFLQRAGGPLEISGFTTGTGYENVTATLTPAAGQGDVKVIDYREARVTANATGTLATASSATLKLTGNDVYSLKLSDGKSTYTMGPTVVDLADANSTRAFVKSLNNALGGSSITASMDTRGNVYFNDASGGTISLQSFTSATGKTGTWEPKAGQGEAVALNGTGLVGSSGGASGSGAVTTGTGSVSQITIGSQKGATDALAVIDNALTYVNSERSKLGAVQNRLQHTVSNLTNIVTNTEASKSRITDTDYAKETTALARNQIIQQAATAMLAQANQQPQSVLALLK